MYRLAVDVVAEQLGPEGPGFAHIMQQVPVAHLQEVRDELTQPDVAWTPQNNSFVNARGVEVRQAFDVFAFKCSRGDQSLRMHLPAFMHLGEVVTKTLIKPLGEHFPSLQAWQLDEVTAQRYAQDTGRLSWHRDLARHPGIIAICNVLGRARLGVRIHTEEHMVTLRPGDIVLLRAPGLFDASRINGDIRPEHAVLSAEGEAGRISVTVRANTRPYDPIQNFHYANWDPLEKV